MSSSLFKHKIKELLHSKTNSKNITRNNFELKLNNTLINTSRKIKRNNTSISITYISPFHYFHSKKLSRIKSINKYDIQINKKEKNLRQIKIFDEINNFRNMNNNNNFDKINFKTIEYFNKYKRRNSLKRYNSFKGLNNKEKIHILNKAPKTLKNELYKVDKNFLKGISPIENFINMNKRINEYKKEKKGIFMEKQDNFYFDINSIREKNKKKKNLKFKYSESNKKYVYHY